MQLDYNKEKETISIDTTSKVVWIVQILIVVVLFIELSFQIVFWKEGKFTWFIVRGILFFYFVYANYKTYKKRKFKKEIPVDQVDVLKEYLTIGEVKYDFVLKNGESIELGSIPYKQLQKIKTLINTLGIGFIAKI